VVLGAGEAADVESEITAPIPGLVWGTRSNGPTQLYTGSTYLSASHPSSQTQTSYSSQGGEDSSGGVGSGLGQILANLYNTLVQPSAALSSYASGKSSH
jgi:hypothetical protein